MYIQPGDTDLVELVKTQFIDLKDDPNTIVNEFRRRFYDTGLLGDRYAGNKFAEYLFRRHDAPPRHHASDHAHRVVEENAESSLDQPSEDVS